MTISNYLNYIGNPGISMNEDDLTQKYIDYNKWINDHLDLKNNLNNKDMIDRIITEDNILLLKNQIHKLELEIIKRKANEKILEARIIELNELIKSIKNQNNITLVTI